MKANFQFQQGQIEPGSFTCTKELPVETTLTRRGNWLRHTRVASGACSENSPLLPLKDQSGCEVTHPAVFELGLCCTGRQDHNHRTQNVPSQLHSSRESTTHTEWFVIMGWGCRNWTEAWLQQRAVIHKCWHSPFCTAQITQKLILSYF